MTPQIERRKAERDADEALSPEYLALLEVCGGEIREGDRAALARRRAGNERVPGDAGADSAGPALSAPDRARTR